MRSRKTAQSSGAGSNIGADQSDSSSSRGQANHNDQDVICLVYPDGSIRTVVPEVGKF